MVCASLYFDLYVVTCTDSINNLSSFYLSNVLFIIQLLLSKELLNQASFYLNNIHLHLPSNSIQFKNKNVMSYRVDSVSIRTPNMLRLVETTDLELFEVFL